MSTMPAPPPNGESSTDRWGSVAHDLRSWTRTSSTPERRALPIRLCSAKLPTMSGKIVKTSTRMAGRAYDRRRPRRPDHAWSRGPSGSGRARGRRQRSGSEGLGPRPSGSGGRAATRSEVEQALGQVDGNPPGTAVDHEHHGHERPGVELEEVGGGVGDHGHAAADEVAADGHDLGTDQVVDPHL